LKAPWATPFEERATRPEPFHLTDGEAVPVPTMKTQGRLGHRREDGFTAVTVPYAGGGLQLLVLLPDAVDGLAALTAKLTPEMLAEFAQAGGAEVRLHLPKFKLEPPMMPLGQTLQTLGMRTAFDQPERSANFDRMAPRKPDDYLFISEVYHQTFLDLDEKGTEAAAATAVVMMRPTSVQVDPPQPVEVRVDRPFLFAIQHRSSGACLFLGRVVDPR
jgi:serpin B